MPEGMPGNVSQGFIFRAITDDLNALRKAGLSADLNQLKTDLLANDENGDPVNEVLSLIGTYVPSAALRPRDKKHLRDHWLGSDGVGRSQIIWWPEVQPIEPILRDGFAELAGRLAVATDNSTVNCIWICAGHALEVVILESDLPTGDKHFATLVLTPSVPLGRRFRTPRHNDIYQFSGDEPLTVIRGDGVSPAETTKDGEMGGRSITVVPKSLEKK